MKKTIVIAISAISTILMGCTNQLKATKWGSEIDAFTFEKMKIELPYIESDSFEYKITEDNFGDPLLCIYCMYNSEDAANNAETSYYDLCAKAGFTVQSVENYGYDETSYSHFSYNTNYADKLVSKNLGAEIQFLVSTYKNKDTLGIFAYPYIYQPETEFPSLIINHFLGESNGKKVPSIKGDSYSYTFDTDYYGTNYLAVNVLGVDYEAEEECFNKCLNSGYYIMYNDDQDTKLTSYPEYGTYSYFYAIDKDMKFGFAFSYNTTSSLLDIEFFLA